MGEKTSARCMLGADRVGSRRRSPAPIVQVIAETLLGGVAIAAPFNPHLVHHLVLFRGSCGQHGSSGFVVACQTYHRAGHLRLAARLGAWEP